MKILNHSLIAAGLLSCALAMAQKTPILYVTNSGGDDVNVIDVNTMKQISDIAIGKKPHGVCAPADGKSVFITIQSTSILQIVDTSTNKVTGTVQLPSDPVGAQPNECASTPDGQYIAVPMRYYTKDQSTAGFVDIVKMPEQKVVKMIPVAFPHNCYDAGTNDFLYCESRGKGEIYRLNMKTLAFDATYTTGDDPRPFSVSKDKKTIYTALGNYSGFEIVNLEKNTTERIALDGPPEPEACQTFEPQTPTHGVMLAPNGKEVWVTSMGDSSVHLYDLEKKKWTGSVHTGACPNWLSMTSDGKYLAVSNCGANTVSIVDAHKKEVAAELKTGLIPKRILVVSVPKS